MLVLSCAVVPYMIKNRTLSDFPHYKRKYKSGGKRKKLKGALTKTSKYKADTTHFENAFFASKQRDEKFSDPCWFYLQEKCAAKSIFRRNPPQSILQNCCIEHIFFRIIKQ